MHPLESILDTGAGPTFISKKELLYGVVTQMSARPLSNICKVNKNLLKMLRTIKFQVHLGHWRVVLNFIVCDTLAASATIGTDF